MVIYLSVEAEKQGGFVFQSGLCTLSYRQGVVLELLHHLKYINGSDLVMKGRIMKSPNDYIILKCCQ